MDEERHYYASGGLYQVCRERERIAYYENGLVKTQEFFFEGKHHGTCTLYWPNGLKKRQVHFCHGVRHGKDLFWNEKGGLLGEYTYEQGEEM